MSKENKGRPCPSRPPASREPTAKPWGRRRMWSEAIAPRRRLRAGERVRCLPFGHPPARHALRSDPSLSPCPRQGAECG